MLFTNSRHSRRLALLACAAALLLIYWPGLYGRFLLDDFAHIVLNKRILHLANLEDLIQLFVSGHAGPGGRPIALLTFAVQNLFTQLDPFYLKLFNLLIHVANMTLVYLLIRQLAGMPAVRQLQSANLYWLRLFPLVCAAWWAFNPTAISTVLYIVQRMTSLSATFTLIALLLYARFRLQSIEKGNGNGLAFLSLAIFTVLAYFTKETGLLTLGYAYLIDGLLLRFAGLPTFKHLNTARIATYAPLVIVAVALWYVYPSYIASGYVNRPFTLSERALTEARVLWFYAGQILLPNSTAYSLYHDDFELSRHLAQPISTLFAIAGHAIAILTAILMRRKAPLIALGIFWFYLGHSLESTIFPLELVYEHRNYLPMLGLLLAASSIPFNFPAFFQQHARTYWLYLALISGSALVTGGLAIIWGSSSYPLLQAERKPLSLRANHDAALSLKDLMETNPELIPKYREDAKRYYLQAIDASNKTASPTFMAPYTGMISLCLLLKEPLPDGLLQELIYKLRHGPIHPVVTNNILIIHRFIATETTIFTIEDAEQIYQAIIENPKSPSFVLSNTLIAYGFLWKMRGNAEKKLEYLEKAVEVAPLRNETRLIYAEELIKQNRFAEAQHQIDSLRKLDVYRYFIKETDDLQNQLNNASTQDEHG